MESITELSLADLAADALIAEAELTPKPALVDRRGPGAHHDLDLALLRRSIEALRPSFHAMAEAASGRRPDRSLREDLAAIGRDGEDRMMAATGGSNAHRGAIWVMGLLIAGAVIAGGGTPVEIAATAGTIARWPDRFAPPVATNGGRVCQLYGVPGARGEARAGFPHVTERGLPALCRSREAGAPEGAARLDALLSIMTSLDDTCLLHRGGWTALLAAKGGARAVLAAGGSATAEGWRRLQMLDAELLARFASPGGSADLLAATLFLDRLDRENTAWNA